MKTKTILKLISLVITVTAIVLCFVWFGVKLILVILLFFIGNNLERTNR